MVLWSQTLVVNDDDDDDDEMMMMNDDDGSICFSHSLPKSIWVGG